VSTTSPAANATGVAVGSNVTATFSENVTGVTAARFTLRQGTTTTGALIARAVTYNATTHVATLNPTANLAAGTVYTARLLTGITDIAGNPLAPVTWSFTTLAPNPPPTVTARTPAINATGVARINNITATFSEAVTGVSATSVTLNRVSNGNLIGAVVSYNTTTRVATLNPNATLLANTQYRVTLTGGPAAIRDLAGAPLATTTWTFTTGP
jgi:methionine-rich copper-binding protein CopC